MKRKIIFLFLIFNILLINIAISQTYEWGKAIGSDGSDRINNIDIDKDGNIYSIGYFAYQGGSIADFDPSDNIYELTSKGDGDIFILKLNRNGNFVWAKSIGGYSNFDFGYSIATDSKGNTYSTGVFTSTVDFDPGIGVYNLIGNDSDIFVLKLDKDGNFVWAENFGSFGRDIGYSIITDRYDNIYVSGLFWSTAVDFDPGPNVFNLNSSKGNIFVLKLDSNGNFIWARNIGGTYNTRPEITQDNLGNIYITGDFRGTWDYNPGVDVYNLTSKGESDIFVCKLNSNGDFIWAKSIGGTKEDIAYSLAINSQNDIYITGKFEDVIQYNSVQGLSQIVSNGYSDICIFKLNSNGNIIWGKSIGGISVDEGRAIDIDKSDNVYISGSFAEKVDLNPNTEVFYESTNGSLDIFLLKLNSTGDFIWAKSFISKSWDEAFSIYLDKYNNIYSAGLFGDDLEIDFDQDTFYIMHSGDSFNAFILKLSQCLTSFDTTQVQTCNSYTWIDGKTYTTSTDTAEYILTNIQGCDSIVSLDLTIYKKDSIGMQITACNEYIWKDDTLKNTDIYRFDTLNIYGCDSTVTLDLKINKSSDSSFKVISCDSYIWHDSSYTQSGIYRFDTINAVGCDSTVTLDLTLNSSSSTTLEKSACESYTWHDSIFTNSGTYRFDTLNITGCDSTVILNLTIVDKIENLDTMYICQGDTIDIFNNKIWEEKQVSKTFTSQKGCDSIQNIQVAVKPLPEGTITESICEGDSIFVLNRWISEEGTYAIHKENAGECDSLYSVDITIRPLKYTYDTINICQGDTIEVFGFEISSETDVEQSYVGSNDCDSTVYMHITVLPLSSSQSQITLCPGDSILISGNWVKTAGEYQEHLTGINSCDSIANIQVKVLTKPEEPSIEIDCDIPEILLSTTATPPWHIQWDNGDTTSQSIYQNQSQAILTLQTDMGCKEIYTIALPTLPDLAQIPNLQDTTIDLNQTLNLSINTDTSNWQINWSPKEIIDCPNCHNISISPEETTVIKLSLTHSSGCTYNREFTLYVQEPELEIPNIFTPNGDGINDNWTFRVPKEIKLISCTIFDRWGEKIYQSRGDTPINWDGKYKSGSVLSGVYVYIIEYVDSKGENRVIAGDVTVVR